MPLNPPIDLANGLQTHSSAPSACTSAAGLDSTGANCNSLRVQKTLRL
jgi:hypothetical protein